MRDLSHGRCVQRVCCSSWSCTPHDADCPSIDDWAHTLARYDRLGRDPDVMLALEPPLRVAREAAKPS